MIVRKTRAVNMLGGTMTRAVGVRGILNLQHGVALGFGDVGSEIFVCNTVNDCKTSITIGGPRAWQHRSLLGLSNEEDEI